MMVMNDIGIKVKNVRRPTEEKALAAIAKQAILHGLSQVEFLNAFVANVGLICHCPYCKRKRARLNAKQQ